MGVLHGVGVSEGTAASDSLLASFECARSTQFPLLFVVFADFVAVPAERNRLACGERFVLCLLYTSPSPRDRQKSRMPSSA